MLAFAKNVDNLDAVLPTVLRIAHKHVSRGVTPEHYAAVGECLLFAIGDVLGAAATEPIMTAWEEAFGFLADTCIATEKDLREKLAEAAGFDGMVDMRVSSTDDGTEDDQQRMIGFVPMEYDVPPYAKGQFVAVVVDGLMTSVPLVVADGDQKEMTVNVRDNKEKATIALQGLKVGDVVKVSMPCGKSL